MVFAIKCEGSTVWPEILVERYFGKLLKLGQLAEFTLAAEEVIHKNIYSKMANALGIKLGWELVSDCTTPTQKQRTGCQNLPR